MSGAGAEVLDHDDEVGNIDLSVIILIRKATGDTVTLSPLGDQAQGIHEINSTVGIDVAGAGGGTGCINCIAAEVVPIAADGCWLVAAEEIEIHINR